MSQSNEFKDYIVDQLSSIGRFEAKNMFGGTALLSKGRAFAKIKHGSLWLKVDEDNISDFASKGMTQYTYGRDNSRKLNFYETPAEILEEKDILIAWVQKAIKAANNVKH